MKEQDLCAQLREEVAHRLPGHWIKHADRSTIGVPDVSFTYRGRTVWIETKLVKLSPLQDSICLRDVIYKKAVLQYETMRRLDQHGISLYVVWATRRGRWWTLIVPRVWPEVALDTSVSLTALEEGKGWNTILKTILERIEGRNER